MQKFIIVGCGLFGITLARLLAEAGNPVSILEKKDLIGGHCNDYRDEDTNIIVQRYGPHIFHINDREIYNFVRRFTDFNNYKHHVLTQYHDKLYEFPINLATVNSFYGVTLRPYELASFLKKEAAKYQVNNPANLEEKVLGMIGLPLYEAFFKEYTTKQWGKEPKNLPTSIVNRIPVKSSYDTNYYKKYFNGIPSDGFTSMFKRMLDHKNITQQYNVNFLDDSEYFLRQGTVVFTGPIDAFFDCKYGKLEYRSLRFEMEKPNVQDWQGISVVNYPELKYQYTRICEPRHFYPEKWKEFSNSQTLILKEIPFSSPTAESYYPIQDKRNSEIFAKYFNEAKQLKNVFFGGRLGEYKYFDMEDTIKSAMRLASRLIA